MKGVIDYYQRPPDNYRKIITAGLFCIAPIQFVLDKEPSRLRLDYYDPAKPHNVNYTLEETDIPNFDPISDPSIRNLGLPSDNFLLAVGYKLRFCIIVSDPLSNAPYPSPIDQGFIVIPLYSVHDPAGNYKTYISRDITLLAQAYQLNNTFYLPESEEHGVKESFARLDRIQFVRSDHLIPKPIMLTEKAIDLLRQWIGYYHGIPILDPALEEYMRRAKDQIDKRLGNI